MTQKPIYSFEFAFLHRKKEKVVKGFPFNILNVVSATFLLVCFSSLNESTCQTRKNVIKCLSIKQEIHFTEQLGK